MLQLYVVTSFVLIPFFQCNFLQQAHCDFRGIFLSNTLREGSFFLFVLYAHLIRGGAELLSLARLQILAALIGSATAFTFARPYLRFSRRVDPTWTLRLFHFGKYVLGTNLSSMLIKSIDQFMLMSLVPVAPAASVALYSTAVKIGNLVEIPTQSVSEVVLPKSAERLRQQGPAGVGRLYGRSVGFMLAVSLPLVALTIALAKPVINLAAGPDYRDAAPMLQVLMLYTLLLPFLRQFGGAMDVLGKPAINFFCTLLAAVTNIVLNYVCIRQFGTIGAAYGTLLTGVLLFLVNQWILQKLLKINLWSAVQCIREFYVLAWVHLQSGVRSLRTSSPPGTG